MQVFLLDNRCHCNFFSMHGHWRLQVSTESWMLKASKLFMMSKIMLVDPPLQIRFSLTAEKLYTFRRWIRKQPYGDRLCTYIVLHSESKEFNCRNTKKVTFYSGGGLLRTIGGYSVLTNQWCSNKWQCYTFFLCIVCVFLLVFSFMDLWFSS